MAKSWTYGGPWRKGQRCIIPAQLYVEPYWGTGKHIPWQFERADGQGLAKFEDVHGSSMQNWLDSATKCCIYRSLELSHKNTRAQSP